MVASTAVEEKINQIINKRRQMRPTIQNRLNKLYSLNNDIKGLYDILDKIINNNDLDNEFKEKCKLILSNNLNMSFTESIVALEHIKGRFERESINIGVTGHSQVGKSTLLQKISGLGNEQIPSGDGKPTTAARSRIFNVLSKEQEGATITFYSESEFIKIVLTPYFNQLQPFFNEINKNNSNKLRCPVSVNEFLNMKLPVDLVNSYFERASDSFKNVESDGKRTNANDEAVLKRLWEMQHDSETWKPLLNQYNKRITLNEIKKYIAYPTDEEIENSKNLGKSIERAYLAVKDVEINCCFKNANVQHLGIFDLPGLGEIIPQESMFCIMQYSTELDLTVLITRPTTAYKSFTDHDSKALANANDVRKPVKNAEDFTVIVINKDSSNGINDSDIDSLKKEINNYFGSSRYNIFTGDIRNPEDLQSILDNILNHLAARLEQMDKDYLEEAVSKANKLCKDCEKVRNLFIEIIRKYNTTVPNAQIFNKARSIKQNLAKSFDALRKQYKKYSEEGRNEEELSLKTDIENICEDNDNWAENGLGKGSPNEWVHYAENTIAGDRGIGGLIDFEFNRMRTRLSKCWSKIDLRLTKKIQQLYFDISNIIRENTGDLVQEENGKEYLVKFLDACEHLDLEQTGDKEKCEIISEALMELLKLNIQYRSLFNESARNELDGLDVYNVTNEYLPEIAKSSGNLELCFKRLKNIFIAKNNAIKDGLEEEAYNADWILYNALVYFIDLTMYSETAEDEFTNLCFSYPDLIFANPANKLMTTAVSELKEGEKKLREVKKALEN